MELLAQITIYKGRDYSAIQLLEGDLSAIPREHAVDILVVSAFPNSYIPLKGTLFLALHERGLSVETLAKNKASDLLAPLGCWLSAPLTPTQRQQFNFKQILCFEPGRHSKEPQTIVGNIFRCINTFAFNEDNDEIAMPVLASGNQKVPIEQMMPALLENAIFWLQNGLPLKCIKLVLHGPEQVRLAKPIFEKIKQQTEKTTHEEKLFIPELPEAAPDLQHHTLNTGSTTDIPEITVGQIGTTIIPPEPPTTPGQTSTSAYDLFISYAHKQTEAVNEFVRELKARNDRLNIFYDRNSIPPGGMWIRKISDAIQHSKAVLCILTPAYSQSDVCWDEFQCAKVMELRNKTSVIKTIYFMMDKDMPPIFAIYSYIDCTEADIQKLKNAVDQFC
ncbi:MAG TPA: toll/interleukin-1 receptor domain-containing protein [Agriterribacter sp.]|nr:toll/interleukin-1 receptor domain-containing protein [Chitinophagaceae bacterium]HRP31616.1 toll/interleukin-1 receptor domain-containing protein [Agriterribacter sp.]